MAAVALAIGGSDPSGGAGIQADLKTFHQFGVYGEAVLSLLTVQNTRGLSCVEHVSGQMIEAQIRAVLEDIPPQAVKTGALGTVAAVEVIAQLAKTFSFPLVVDPVMIGKHGTRLLTPKAEERMKRELLPHAWLVTPNIPEAESLAGMEIRDEDAMAAAGKRILEFGCRAVLVKGGHLEGEPADILHSGTDLIRFWGRRVASKHTHGTGCTYAAAITAGLALGNGLEDAIRTAREYVQRAIETAPGLGKGFGPVNHFSPVTRA